MLGSNIFLTLDEDAKYPNLLSRWVFTWFQENEAMFMEHKNKVLYYSCTL